MKKYRKSQYALLLFSLFSFFVLCACGAEKSSFEKGILTENGYESRWLGLKWEAPEHMFMLSDEEMRQKLLASQESAGIAEEAQEQALAAALEAYEMMAGCDYGAPNVVIMTEKLPSRAISVDDYIDALTQSFAEISALGYAAEGTRGSAMLAGKAYSTADFSVAVSGLELHQRYFLRRQEDRMISVIVTYMFEDDLNIVLDAFSEI